jgi:hypothetical protein
MFVNVSPADYNLEETQTSLYYATRVKQIVNDPIKHNETREMSKLKDQVKALMEEKDYLRRLLNQKETNLSNRSHLGSLSTTPNKHEDDSRYDDGPLHRSSINDRIRYL